MTFKHPFQIIARNTKRYVRTICISAFLGVSFFISTENVSAYQLTTQDERIVDIVVDRIIEQTKENPSFPLHNLQKRLPLIAYSMSTQEARTKALLQSLSVHLAEHLAQSLTRDTGDVYVSMNQERYAIVGQDNQIRVYNKQKALVPREDMLTPPPGDWVPFPLPARSEIRAGEIFPHQTTVYASIHETGNQEDKRSMMVSFDTATHVFTVVQSDVTNHTQEQNMVPGIEPYDIQENVLISSILPCYACGIPAGFIPDIKLFRLSEQGYALEVKRIENAKDIRIEHQGRTISYIEGEIQEVSCDPVVSPMGCENGTTKTVQRDTQRTQTQW